MLLSLCRYTEFGTWKFRAFKTIEFACPVFPSLDRGFWPSLGVSCARVGCLVCLAWVFLVKNYSIDLKHEHRWCFLLLRVCLGGRSWAKCDGPERPYISQRLVPGSLSYGGRRRRGRPNSPFPVSFPLMRTSSARPTAATRTGAL